MKDHLRHSTKVEIRSVAGKGVGVFALTNLPQGTLVEECPYVALTKEEGDRVSEVSPVLSQYIFYTEDPVHTSPQAVVLGYGSLYNHSNKPNLVFFADSTARTMSFIAKRDIEEGEELTFDYEVDLGFEPV